MLVLSNVDVVVIGAGPGGYSCAIRCSQLGLKTVIIEKDKLGGVCTNTGCIPTKALCASAKLIRKIQSAKQFGIEIPSFTPNFTQALKRANMVSNNLSKGIEILLKSNNVEIVRGTAEIIDGNKVKVGENEIETKNIVLATGGTPIELPFAKFNGKNIISSEDFFSLEKIPNSVVIIGGGYEGCEFANILNAFGVKVTIVELSERLLPREDSEVSEFILKTFSRYGINCLIGKKVVEVNENGVILENGEKIETDKVLVVVGRRPNSNEKLESTKHGIKINDFCETSMKNVYAIGDVTGGGVAHVASFQGELVAQNIMGKDMMFDRKTIPSSIFTDPEIAMVGDCSGGEDIKIGKFPFIASGKAVASGEKNGFVKVFVRGHLLIGCIIIGMDASSLIAEPTLAIKNYLTIEQIANTIHAHPTFSEAFVEAVRDVNKESVYLPKG